MFIVCAVYDRKQQEFGTVFVSRTEQTAIRMFADGITTDPNSLIARHPEDFFLAGLGTLEEESGDIAPWANGTYNVFAEARTIMSAVQPEHPADMERAGDIVDRTMPSDQLTPDEANRRVNDTIDYIKKTRPER